MAVSYNNETGTNGNKRNQVFFIVQMVVISLLMTGATVDADKCSCPSCLQRDAVQRCACCVYRQHGKRSQMLSFPGIEESLDSQPWTNTKNTEASSDTEDESFAEPSSQGSVTYNEYDSDIDSSLTPKDGFQDTFSLRSQDKRTNHNEWKLYRAKVASLLMDILEENSAHLYGGLVESQANKPAPLSSYKSALAWDSANVEQKEGRRRGMRKFIRDLIGK